ncbi:hypothetical protein LQW54_001018 [Pestalotiopsis sp. IQ-011]
MVLSRQAFTSVTEDPLGRAWNTTFRELGFGVTKDPYSGRGVGAWSTPASIDPKTRTRSYAASAYLAPVRGRLNLHVVTGAMVSRIVLQRTKAKGVNFRQKDSGAEGHQAQATREVILAAGAFQSPKRLELSGIENKLILEKYDIAIRVENESVGENLQDHLMTGISFEAADGVMTGDCLLRQEPEFVNAFTPEHQQLFSDSLAKSEAQVESIGTDFEKAHHKYVASVLKGHFQDEASAALFMLPAQVDLHNGPKQSGMVSNVKPGNYISLGAALLHPLSWGSSHISSADPSAPPVIDQRYLSHPLDVEVFARHIMALEVLAETPPLATYLKPDGRRAQGHDGKNAHATTLEKARKYVKETTLTNNHPVGTCAMLPLEKGVAEKAADLIKEDHAL